MASTRKLIAGLGLVLVVGAIVAHRYSNVGIAFDGEGYYAYLPAWFVQHDPTFTTYVAEHPNAQAMGILFPQSNGHFLDKYSVGTALLILPFFLAGEAVALLTGTSAGGFGTASQIALSLSMIAFCLAGVWALHRVLLRSFTPAVSLMTIGCVLFGTDLFHQVTHEPAFSHAYTFGLVSLLLLASVRRHEGDHTLRLAAGIGALCGFIVIVRPVNVVLLPFVFLVGITSWESAMRRVRGALGSWRPCAAGLGAALAVIAPQIVVWLIATGRPIVYSYGDNHEYFEFSHPHIVDVLFSFGPHGLLPWSPVLILVPLGLWPLRRYAPHLVLPLLVVLPLNLYVVASWYQWWYGGGFGLRPFIDSLPFMALPLAAVLAWARRPLARAAVWGFGAACTALTLVLMYHYWRRQIAPDGISAREYVRVVFHH
ncbi:MAG TPA: hypothetical protein VFO60_12010 [Candidatus Dormibacteraeota bacterium]|nr:hypothetical protein [Candidatus Dormibacteraeota bacterium]